MKKLLAVILASLSLCALLISCSDKKDGKCDECGKDAYVLTDDDKEVLDMFNIEIEGEFCDEHLEKAIEEATLEMLGA